MLGLDLRPLKVEWLPAVYWCVCSFQVCLLALISSMILFFPWLVVFGKRVEPCERSLHEALLKADAT